MSVIDQLANAENDLGRMADLEDLGHHMDCAVRMVWGDGECECGKITKPDTLSQAIRPSRKEEDDA